MKFGKSRCWCNFVRTETQNNWSGNPPWPISLILWEWETERKRVPGSGELAWLYQLGLDVARSWPGINSSVEHKQFHGTPTLDKATLWSITFYESLTQLKFYYLYYWFLQNQWSSKLSTFHSIWQRWAVWHIAASASGTWFSFTVGSLSQTIRHIWWKSRF